MENLPPETATDLTYETFVATVIRLEGEVVSLILTLGHTSRLQVQGPLRHYDYSRAHGLAVGDAGRLLVSEQDFSGATLSTFDGTTHFYLRVRLGREEVVIGNPSAVGTDEFDLFP